MKRLFARFLSRRIVPDFDAPLAPDAPFAAIGDVHGCDDLLVAMLDRVDRAGIGQVVMLGDYIDRGDQSAEVLRRLAGREGLVCLRGNHEEMALEFLRSPEKYGPRWLRNGGIQTLASFGIGGVSLGASPEALHLLSERFRAALGDELFAWLEALPLTWTSGNVTCLHAGADPELPIDLQDRAHLLWGHPDFFKRPRGDGRWVVHGHTIMPEAGAENGRISVDTGAYATGTLSAALIGPEGVSFLSEQAGGTPP